MRLAAQPRFTDCDGAVVVESLTCRAQAAGSCVATATAAPWSGLLLPCPYCMFTINTTCT